MSTGIISAGGSAYPAKLISLRNRIIASSASLATTMAPASGRGSSSDRARIWNTLMPAKQRGNEPRSGSGRRERPPIDRLPEFQRRAGLGHRVFEPSRAIEQHRALPRADAPLGDRLLVSGIGRRALGAEQQSLRRRNLAPGLHNRLVIDGGRETAAVAHRAQDQKIADRLRHPDAGGEGVRVLPARRVLLARFPGLYHRRAARSL